MDEQLTPSQRAAIGDIHRNIALRSGAGCGKTFVLSRRFTNLLVSDPQTNPLERLVALTFTEKAAVEMSDRVRRILTDLAAKARGDDRVKLLGWLESLPNARISTIHGFCAATLRTYAIEAGLDPSFQVCADDLAAGAMLAEAADQAVLSAVEANQSDLLELLAHLPYQSVVDLVFGLVQRRTDADLSAYDDPAATLAKWTQWAAAIRDAGLRDHTPAIAAEISELAAIPCRDAQDKLEIYRRDFLGVLREAIADADAMERLTSAPPSKPRGGKAAAWGGKDVLDQVSGRLKALVDRVRKLAEYMETPGELDERSAQALATLCRLARDANARYDKAKRQAGLLDFTDLLERTGRLIESNPSVRAAIADRIEQLLVDEAQDTDAFQLRLLEHLVAPSGASVPDGKLFVVGDGKQSIYRFRGARVEVFEDLCKRLGRRENLDLSFRTHAAGVAWANHIFGQLMEGFEPIRAKRTAVPPEPCVEILVAEPGDNADSAAATDAQAQTLAQRIRQMVDGGEKRVWDRDANAWRPVRYGDIAVLLTRMTSSLEYERRLVQQEVPYYVVAGAGFFQQQEVFDLLNALRVIDNPLDDVALAGVLRSSIFGLDDNVLMQISQQFRPPFMPALRGSCTNDGCHAHTTAVSSGGHVDAVAGSAATTLPHAVDLLWNLHRSKDAVGIAEIIERVLRETGYEAALLAHFNGRRAMGNVRMLLDRARSADQSGMALAQFVAQMDQMVLAGERYEQAAVAGEHEDVVRIMTVHKAKGLEFPVVFLPDLNAGRRGGSSMMLTRDDWGLTLRLRDDEDGDAKPVSYRLARELEDREDEAEDIRLLYVAMTRAEDHLVLIGANWRDKDGRLRSTGSYLRALDGVLGLAELVDHALTTEAQSDGRKPPTSAVVVYGPNGEYEAIVRTVSSFDPPRASRTPTAGKKLLAASGDAGELARAIITAAPPSSPPPLVGPLDPACGRCEVAVTALGEFAQCPMLYRWRYELRVPHRYLECNLRGATPAAAPAAPQAPAALTLDAATVGTIYHRCMELMDFANPTPVPLVKAVLAEMQLEGHGDTAALCEELGQMIDRLRQGELWQSLATARRTYRELDFLLDLDGCVLRGQIDLIYEDAAGAWHIVDYKSDRVRPDDIAARAEHYRLQMVLYGLAAWKYLGTPPTEARLYFLRPSLTHAFAFTPESLQADQAAALKLTHSLAAAKRTGRFDRVQGQDCGRCSYGSLCRQQQK